MPFCRLQIPSTIGTNVEEDNHKMKFNVHYNFLSNRHQHFGRTPCETDENVFFGSNLDYSNYEIPFDLDRSEQETTTEL